MTNSPPPPQPHEGPLADGQRQDPLAAQAAWLEREQPAYLVAALGRPRSPLWRALALEIERYRRASGISSRVSALGPAPPTRSHEGREWQQLARRIAESQGVAGVGFDDLCVFPAQMDHVQEQAALSVLETRRWLGVLAPREIQIITRMPTLALRRHVTFAALLLSGRPKRSMKLAPLQAEVADVQAHQAAHEAAVREVRARLRALRGRPAQEVGAAAVRLSARLQVHQAALARVPVLQREVERLQAKLGRSGDRASRSNGLHQLPVAIGLHSAYELARRDLEALIALERDPPTYLARALGTVPFVAEGRAAWREGARLIERYRAEHGINDPGDALGPRRSGYKAGHARQEVAEQIEGLRVALHRGVVLGGRDLPDELPGIDLGPL
jgi:hypothetical protein